MAKKALLMIYLEESGNRFGILVCERARQEYPFHGLDLERRRTLFFGTSVQIV